MTTTRIKVNDFIKASRTYVEKSLAKANRNKNAYLSPSEQKKLPKDLRDNLKNSGRTGSVKTQEFATAFTKYVSVNAKKADLNKDGTLSAADAARLPKDLRDNFKNYVSASRQVWSSESTVKDKTSATRIAQHLAEYGQPKVTYSDAFAKGVKAILDDRDYGPGGVLKEIGDGEGNALTNAQIRAQLEKAFKSMTLLPIGEAGETGFDPKTQWVFAVDCDVGSDHGFWVAIDRQTGATEVTNFN